MTSINPRAKLMEAMQTTLSIMAKFDKARAGRKPYSAVAPCTVCRKPGAMIHYEWRGPRAIRMACDNPACSVRMMA